MEFNDVYDENRNLTGKVHRRGTHWKEGEFGLVVCVWVYDGRGHFLLTRRAKGKSGSFLRKPESRQPRRSLNCWPVIGTGTCSMIITA